jgi:hypothetical protein
VDVSFNCVLFYFILSKTLVLSVPCLWTYAFPVLCHNLSVAHHSKLSIWSSCTSMKCSSYLVSILQPPPHTTYPTCMTYTIQVDNFLRFTCLWTNVDVSLHCIVSYYTVSITLLLSIPYFSLSCTPLQVVNGQEKPVKPNVQP